MSHLSTVKKVSDPDAFSSSSTSYVNIGELLDDPTTATGSNPWNMEKLTTLVNMIYGSEGYLGEQISELQEQLTESDTATAYKAITAADLRAKTYNKTANKSIVVRLGGLDWIVTYVSNDINGNLIATLWLSNNHQEAWGWNGTGGDTFSNDIGRNETLGTSYALINGGLYSSSGINDTYGTSYIRVETLNNPDNRRYEVGGTLSSEIAQQEDHIFSLYTVADKGLTRFLTTPNQMKWMINMQTPAKRGEIRYWWNNESLTTENAYNFRGSWREEYDNPLIPKRDTQIGVRIIYGYRVLQRCREVFGN